MGKTKRHDRLLIPGPLIEASRAYRDALMQASRELNPRSPTYTIASGINSSINDLMAEVTGQRDLFSDRAHSN